MLRWGAFREVLAQLPAAAQGEIRERVALMLSAAPLRAVMVDQVAGPMRLLRELFAERSGRRPDDLAVRTLAGAVLGVGLAAMFAAAEDPGVDIVSLLDQAMSQLEGGLSL